MTRRTSCRSSSWRAPLIGAVALAIAVGCATHSSPSAGTTPTTEGSPAEEIARRETELTAELHDGIATAYPDCREMAGTIRDFRAANEAELAELDRRRRPSDRDYLVAKREAWKRIMGPRSRRKQEATRACFDDPIYRAALRSVPSLQRRSYCKEPPRPPPVAPPPTGQGDVSSEVLEATRVVGDPMIQPDTFDALAMAVEELGTVAVVKLCLATDGSVGEATLLKTSCFDDYDAKLLAGVRSWRYAPFLVDGRPTPVCTSATFVYRPH